ncbi:hypothetical protein Patl1_13458 [Pistacia atlantica]|uniref:Uncharacterized protein n=1 Tax=Pistacia atlantica TaxID=434234 RepID=A0ACC1AS24_9ROSI|nr:hypothetical protein Patl1_13458 [Pistacia atlantica]
MYEEWMEEVAKEAEIPISYKAMFTGMEEMRKVSQNPKDVSEHFEHGREILGIHVEMDELGCPMIIIPEEKNRRMSQPWTHSLIINLMGESIGYMMFKKKVEQLWAHYGNITLINLGYEFFLAHFTTVEDYDYDLTGGPWLMFDHYLVLRQWQPNFDPVVAKIDKISAWVRLLGLSIEYYDVEFLQCVGDLIGNTIKIDEITTSQCRALTVDSGKSRFAVLEDKVCMEKNIREVSYGLVLPEPSHNISQFSKKASTASRKVGENIINKLGYKYLVIAEAKVYYASYSQGKLEWICCFVYASPRSEEIEEPWSRLVDFALVRDPWMVVGDFNDISHPSEKKGGTPTNLLHYQNFSSHLNACNLMEVKTWGSRLEFSESYVKVLPRLSSDYHPSLCIQMVVSLERLLDTFGLKLLGLIMLMSKPSCRKNGNQVIVS